MKVGRHASSIARDRRGAVFVEYVTLLCLVTVIGAIAIVAVGPELLRTFRFAELVLAMPVP